MSLRSLAVGAESADEVLNRFVAHVAAAGPVALSGAGRGDPRAARGKHVILATPTGSGKSLVATALHFKALAEGKTSFYTCPIKALVNEKFFALCEAVRRRERGHAHRRRQHQPDGAASSAAPPRSWRTWRCAIAPRAIDYVVMDEFHYYADKERGVAWQIPLLLLQRRHVPAHVGDARRHHGHRESLEELTGREVAVVRSSERPVPLDFEYRETPLHETIEKLIEGQSLSRLPRELHAARRRRAGAGPDQRQHLQQGGEGGDRRRAGRTSNFDTPYGKEFSASFATASGCTTRGCLPKYRLLVEKLAQQGLSRS